MKLGGNLPPGHDVILFEKWHRICYMPSPTDTAGHTKAVIYPVMGPCGEVKVLQRVFSKEPPKFYFCYFCEGMIH